MLKLKLRPKVVSQKADKKENTENFHEWKIIPLQYINFLVKTYLPISMAKSFIKIDNIKLLFIVSF